jgi:hypothetical protein
VLRAHRVEGLEHHEIEGALDDGRLVRSIWHANGISQIPLADQIELVICDL